MSSTQQAQDQDGTLVQGWLNVLRYYLLQRRGLFILVAILVMAGLATNWSWLVAVGIAPFLLSALPCLAMCALGICMKKGTGRSCQSDPAERVGADKKSLPDG